MADFVDEFMAETANIPSTEPFRLWSAITAVSGALERKVWTVGSAANIYPGMLTVLVGHPASGKTNAIRPVRDIWANIKDLRMSPDNVTKASLIDVLSRSMRTVINSHHDPLIFSSLAVPASEFGVFFTHHDTEFLSVITALYDDLPRYKEERRTVGEIEIIRPHLVLLAGTQPDFLGDFLPETAWGQGFTSRLMFVYSPTIPHQDIFAKKTVDVKRLSKLLERTFALTGEMFWTEPARQAINAWNVAGCPPVPSHMRLRHYNGRRILHTVKLCMIASASRGSDMEITIDDFERAQDWILTAEKTMPDIFRAMGQKSDAQIIADLHWHVWHVWASVVREKRQPVKEKVLYQFLQERVESHRITKIIEIAERIGRIRKATYPGEWIPEPIIGESDI